jgi:hypothetical protein
VTRAIVLLAWAAAIGLAAGVLLDLTTFLVARYGPQADSWSFRGNGALAVPFGLGPAILTGAWVALVLRYRRFANWRELGLAAGLVGTGLLLLSVLVLVAFGSAALIVSSAMTLLILGWMVVAPLLAGLIRALGPLQERGQLGGHLGAGAVFAVVLFAAFYASGIVLAPGS